MRAFSVFLGAALALAGPIAVAPTPNASAAGTGTVLSRSAVPAVNLPSGAVRAVKVLYTTRDQNGRPARSTGVVYYPRGAAPAGGWKVLSWAHGTSGISAKCAPSITSGKRQDEMQPNIAGALARGYVVTATDYIGLGGGGVAEYLGGRSAAYNVIDMIRAARNIDPTIGKRWVSLGHSQGGHAALWAARTAPRYAPELPMLGTVALAPASQIPEITPVFQYPGTPSLGTFNMMSGFGLYLMSGLNNARPDLNALSYLSPVGRQWLAIARDTCVFELAVKMRNVAPGSLWAKATSSSPQFMAALRDYAGIPNTGFGTRGVRLQQGMNDTIVLPISTIQLEGQLRSGGANVSLRFYPGDHMAVTRASMGDTMATVAGYFG